MQTTEQSKTLAKNYNAVKENIKKACEQAGRSQEEVTLLAVSKTKPVDMLMDVYHAGARDFGENKVQELVDKIPQLPSDIRWHLIGHLQRNKVKYIVDKVYLIHSVDSLRLAEEISREAVKKQVEVNILIEVNVAQEESKFGTTTEETEKLVRDISFLPGVHIKEDPEENRIYFRKLRQLAVDIGNKNIDNVSMSILSMGMTGDYTVAVQEGSAIVRVGTGIFGERDYSKTISVSYTHLTLPTILLV